MQLEQIAVLFVFIGNAVSILMLGFMLFKILGRQKPPTACWSMAPATCWKQASVCAIQPNQPTGWWTACPT